MVAMVDRLCGTPCKLPEGAHITFALWWFGRGVVSQQSVISGPAQCGSRAAAQQADMVTVPPP